MEKESDFKVLGDIVCDSHRAGAILLKNATRETCKVMKVATAHRGEEEDSLTYAEVPQMNVVYAPYEKDSIIATFIAIARYPYYCIQRLKEGVTEEQLEEYEPRAISGHSLFMYGEKWYHEDTTLFDQWFVDVPRYTRNPCEVTREKVLEKMLKMEALEQEGWPV